MYTQADLILNIVAAACAYRDFDWTGDGGDPSPVVDGLDKAVDAWRAYLRREKKPEPFPWKEAKP